MKLRAFSVSYFYDLSVRIVIMRRRRIHDSDDDSPPPRATLDVATCPDLPVAQSSKSVAEGVVIVISSDSEGSCDGAGSRGCAPGPAILTPLQFAGKFGRFPGLEDAAMIAAVAEPEIDIDGDGNLWNAVPPKTCQYLDLEAVCVDDTSSGSSAGSDGQLTPGFVDDVDDVKENLSPDDHAFMLRHFPRTLRYAMMSRGCRF